MSKTKLDLRKCYENVCYGELEKVVSNSESTLIKKFILNRCNFMLQNFGQPAHYYNGHNNSAQINKKIDEILSLHQILTSDQHEQKVKDMFISINPNVDLEKEDSLKKYYAFWILFCENSNLWYYGDRFSSVSAELTYSYGEYTTLRLKLKDLRSLLNRGVVSDPDSKYLEYLLACLDKKDPDEKIMSEMFG